jgi:DNA anti-recombination protein RmuC
MYETIIVVLSILTLFSPRLFKSTKKSLSVQELSSMATSMGILFTFGGIAIGLVNFDVNNIQASIPQLLSGLKTAFFTSIAGIAAGIIVKRWPEVYGIKIRKDDAQGATVETLAYLLKQIQQDQKDGFEKLSVALAGDGETTLLTQIQKLRTSVNDNFETLNSSFNEFAEKMVADSTQSLIDALTEVMEDFNTKINEQFGDNFKKLNEAVGAMLEWQQEYKTQVTQLTEIFKQTAQSINDVKDNLEEISNDSSKFAETNDKLSTTLDELLDGLDGLSQLGNQAKETLPVLNSNIEELTNNFSERVKAATENIKEQAEHLTQSQEKISDNTIKVVDEVNKNIKDQFEELDNALSEELKKALEQLGNQLASVSNKFVDDYVPLTNKLKEVIRIAEEIDVKNN